MSIKRVLDRRPRHDERSRNYPVRGLIPGTPEIKPKNWYAGAILDHEGLFGLLGQIFGEDAGIDVGRATGPEWYN